MRGKHQVMKQGERGSEWGIGREGGVGEEGVNEGLEGREG